MFLIWSDGEILGRRLEVENLAQMIQLIKSVNATQKENQEVLSR